GYHGFYKKKSGDQIDGCAILYKKWKFTQVKVVPVQFCQGEILDRDNVGLILLLRPSPRACRGRAKTICVATTHLLFNPKRGDVKLAQLMMFLAEIDKDNSRPQRYCPIILCGDFNSEPFCDLYQLIVTGQLKYEGLVSRLICGQSEGRERGADVYLGQHLLPTHLGVTESCQYVHTLTERHMDREQQNCGTPESQTKQEDVPFSPPQTNSGRAYHSVNFKSVYPHVTEARGRGRGRVMEISSQHDRCSCTVDYIFYTPCSGNSGKGEQGEIQLELLSRYSLLTSEEIACTGPLPNATLPSDHLCLIAQFLLH
ncbi:hypothetical protein EGW08_019946, partial [Elysia chlorotica]